MKSFSRFTVGVTGVIVLSAVSAGVALADPSGSPTYRRLAGVGSDTTQDVMNAIAQTITTATPGSSVGSYDAVGSANITTKDPATVTNTNRPAKCTFTRPNGSGAGRTQLDTDTANATAEGNSVTTDGHPYDGTNGCTDFARSSSLASANAYSGRLTFVPFAVDAVDYAITANSSVPRNLTIAQLTSIYHCDPAFVGTSSAHPLGKDSLNTYDIVPVLPNINSGTRSFWLGKVGLVEGNDATNGVQSQQCIDDQYVPSPNGTGTTVIEEHDGRSISDKQLVPFSIPKWLQEQAGGLGAQDVRGRTLLANINGTNPVLTQNSFAIKRDVYNVIPTSQVGNAPFSTTFVGASSAVCQDTADITKYFFGTNPSVACGSTTLVR